MVNDFAILIYSFKERSVRSESDKTVMRRGLGGNNDTETNPALLMNVSDNGQVDFRVQTIIGYSTRINYTTQGPPIGLDPGDSYHYYIFTGQTSDWSSIQTITIPTGSVTTSKPNPTSSSNPTTAPTSTATTNNSTGNPNSVPLNTLIAVVAIFLAIIVALSLLLFRRHPKSAATRI